MESKDYENWDYFEEDSDYDDDPEQEGEEEAKPDYENSGPLDIQLYSESKEVIDAATFLCGEIVYKSDRAIMHMKVVILNLYWGYLQSPARWIGYSRDKNNYDLVFRYNKQRITYTPLLKVINGLTIGDYITSKKGFRGKGWKTGKCSKMKATAKLIDLLKEHHVTPEMIARHPQEERIFLKNAKKQLIDYDDSNSIIKMRMFLSHYNELLMKTYLDLDVSDYTIIKKTNRQVVYGPKCLYVDLTKKRVWRVFYNCSFKHGGRFYGGWWMGIPSELRKRIVINNQKVVECDYSGLHIHLLYAKEGINYGFLKQDPYTLYKYKGDKKYRKLFKLLMLVAINANNENDTIKSLRKKINFDRSSFPDILPDLTVALQEFKHYHKPIEKYFSAGVGTQLMYTDSRIAELVLQRVTELNIPVLPVHDSFICQKEYVDELLNAMDYSYSTINNKQGNILDAIEIKNAELTKEMTYTGDEYEYDYVPYNNIPLLESMLRYIECGSVIPHTKVPTIQMEYQYTGLEV